MKAVYGTLEYAADQLNKFFSWLKSIADKIGSWFSTNTPDPVDEFGRPIKKMSFTPGMGGGGGLTSFSLNVDGKTLARAVFANAEGLDRYPTSPPSFNGAGQNI